MSEPNDLHAARAVDCCCGHAESEHTWTNGMLNRTTGCGHGDVLPSDGGPYVMREWCECAQYHPAKGPYKPIRLIRSSQSASSKKDGE